MDQNLIIESRDYCERAGISLSTLGVRAVGNSRFFERLQRRMAKAGEDAERLRAYMAANPAREGACE